MGPYGQRFAPTAPDRYGRLRDKSAGRNPCPIRERRRRAMSSYEYAHVDVFTCRRLEGNGLAVVFCPEAFPAPVTMLEIAREFKQFETIFVSDVADGAVEARIFTVDGELPFA